MTLKSIRIIFLLTCRTAHVCQQSQIKEAISLNRENVKLIHNTPTDCELQSLHFGAFVSRIVKICLTITHHSNRIWNAYTDKLHPCVINLHFLRFMDSRFNWHDDLCHPWLKAEWLYLSWCCFQGIRFLKQRCLLLFFVDNF